MSDHWRDYVSAKWRRQLDVQYAAQSKPTDVAADVRRRDAMEQGWLAVYRSHWMDRASRCEMSTLKNDLHYCCPVIAEAIALGVAIDRYRSSHMTERQGRRKVDGINNNCQRKEVQSMCRVMQHAVQIKAIKRNPLAGYSLPRKVQPSIPTPSHGGVESLVQAARNRPRPSVNPGARFVPHVKNNKLVTRDQAMIITQARLGLRPCELVGLTLSDYQPDKGIILIRARKTGTNRELPLAIFPDVQDHIDRYLKVRQRDAKTDRLFLNDRSLPITTYWWSQLFGKIAEAAGIPEVTPLGLRHFGLTAAAEESPLAAMALGGHTSVKTTEKYIARNREIMTQKLAGLKRIETHETGRSARRTM